jgi:hypothetical protein
MSVAHPNSIFFYPDTLIRSLNNKNVLMEAKYCNKICIKLNCVSNRLTILQRYALFWFFGFPAKSQIFLFHKKI